MSERQNKAQTKVGYYWKKHSRKCQDLSQSPQTSCWNTAAPVEIIEREQTSNASQYFAGVGSSTAFPKSTTEERTSSESSESSKGFAVQVRHRWNSVPDVNDFWYYTDDTGKTKHRDVYQTQRVLSPGQKTFRIQVEQQAPWEFPMPGSREWTPEDRDYYSETEVSSTESNMSSIEKVNARVMLEILRWKFDHAGRFRRSVQDSSRRSVANKVMPRQPKKEITFAEEKPIRRHFSREDLEDSMFAEWDTKTPTKSMPQTGSGYLSDNYGYKMEDELPSLSPTTRRVSEDKDTGMPTTRRVSEDKDTGMPIRNGSAYILTIQNPPTMTSSREDWRALYERIARIFAALVVVAIITITVILIF